MSAAVAARPRVAAATSASFLGTEPRIRKSAFLAIALSTLLPGSPSIIHQLYRRPSSSDPAQRDSLRLGTFELPRPGTYDTTSIVKETRGRSSTLTLTARENPSPVDIAKMLNRTAFYVGNCQRERSGLQIWILEGSCRLTLFTAALQTFFGFFAGFVNGKSQYLHIFGKIAAGVSIATWIWLSVLMYYNRRPLSTHALARSLAHVTSFMIISGTWLDATGVQRQDLVVCCRMLLQCTGIPD
ncbi:hypothetical protein FA15DRAFT_652905 [Coprinopsis marcescibilis]|uniref:Uncharacterized protein n=1 Tax=Coprinopsis marcescibilis TaxID=230819 RepID=A0A5C3L669_COPMA|nr:hypothetical protein FA15DRAFT_652905 [Coprinopsis marcescibilis]